MPVAAEDRIVLWSAKGRRFLVEAGEGVVRVGGLGVVRRDTLVGLPWGSEVRLGSEAYRVLPPTVHDALASLERGPQVVLPKDASRIVLECSIGPGATVAEAGVGSGGLTLALAHAVGDEGRVLGYDLRADHLRVARRNLERAGLAGRVELAEADIAHALTWPDLDAIVLDVPDPERVVPRVADRLAVGATLACYTPLVGQMEAGRAAMADAGLAEIRSLELLERPWISHARGTRPETQMLGHTGFLSFGRRVRGPAATPDEPST